MAFRLGDITLPYPKSFKREYLETATENITMQGRTGKVVTNRKEMFTLRFQNLTQNQANIIMNELNLNRVRTFTVDETILSIGPTDVHVDIPSRSYEKTGLEYRENLDLVLTEVT